MTDKENQEVLSDRELMIAKKAAELAVQQLSDDFYKGVGRTLVQKWLIWIGLMAVGFVSGKGWLPPLK